MEAQAQRLGKWIWGISAAVVLAVVVLFFLPKERWAGMVDVSFLPAVNAAINSTVAILLVVGLVLIKRKNWQAHRNVMLTALGLSALFLVSYVAYHAFAPRTIYGGEGALKNVYYVVLITHVLLSITVLPLALFATFRGLTGQYEKHKKIVRWTFPIWLYVAVSGVVVYVLISPYYT